MKRILLIMAGLLLLCMLGCAGWAEENTYEQIDQETAKQMMKKDDGHVVVDVRRQDEYDEGHIPGAVLIPNESIGSGQPEALPDLEQIILIYCRSGRRSKEAAQKLAAMGYTNIYEFGGILSWDGELVTSEEENAAKKEYVLRFSSFSGGGYEYTVEVEDPSVVSCETRYVYEEQAEEITGASYEFFVTLKALAPGTTEVRIEGRSPIMDNEDHVYRVSVDENLRMDLTPVLEISYFYVYRSGEINYDTYEITRDEDGYHVSVNGEAEQAARTAAVNALADVIDAYNMTSWDGFNESRPFVLDGEGFRLEFTLTDGTCVQADGDNAFPEHYFEAMGEIWDILAGITEEEMDMKLFIGETEVPVSWEDNDSVDALKKLLPLTIPMSMYGGFEQVGPIGQSIARNDRQTTTDSGDIVLYSGDQIVIFYGSNSWSYTRLGHVNLSQREMAELLSHGNVTITITE